MKPINTATIEFLSRSANEGFARTAAACFAAQLDPTLEEVNDIKTAVSEAVTNAVVHAYPDRLGKVKLRLRLFEDHTLEVTVQDWGVGIADIQQARTPLFTTGNGERAGMGFTIMESFSDKLKIEYDIQEKKFCVPTLSIQPIVENAIKHGVTKKPEGGTVRISTASDDKDYIVTVKDDGVGFDPSAIEEDDGRSHVGIQNIRYRFENMMHATVSIESEKGVGTCVIIRIPKNSATKEQ